MRPVLAFLVFLAVLPLRADEPGYCGTRESAIRRAQELGDWAAARERLRAEKGLAGRAETEVRDGVILLDADAENAPFFKRFDLQNRTLVFTRRDAQSFVVRTEELQWDEERGAAVTFSGTPSHAVVPLHNFAFPFYDLAAQELYLTANNSIQFVAPVIPHTAYQYGDLEAVSQRTAMIAPLLTTEWIQPGRPIVFTREAADYVLITWSYLRTTNRYDIQAKLQRDGTIRISYRDVTLRGGAIVIASGRDGEATVLASGTDAANDTPNAMLDVVATSVERVAGSSLLQIRIRTRGPIDRAALNGGYATYFVKLGTPAYAQSVDFYLNGGGPDEYYTPLWGQTGLTAARVEGDTITLQLLQEWLALPDEPLAMTVTTAIGGSGQTSDTATSAVRLTPAPRNATVTLRTIANGTELRGPIVESFTLPVLNPQKVWQQLRTAYGLTDEEIDGVAIYQNFHTDLVYYAGAYSTVGNAQADGIGRPGSIGTQYPPSPALLHMNSLSFGINQNVRSISQVLLHEFAHHWLYYIRFRDGDTNSDLLNPDGAHPAQWVDTRAAFPVYTATDSSVMGGATFTPQPNGSFATWPQEAPYGYSWLDLYLMGLAGADEVPPWFYIADSTPALGNAYFPPAGRTFQGTRREVGLQQVVDAMGPRRPAFPNAKRQFRVPFVLIVDPLFDATAGELRQMNDYRARFERDFRLATNGRGEVATGSPLGGGGTRRRATGR